jgi:hypothetical protein
VTPARRRGLLVAAQVVLLGGGIWFLVASARANWAALARFPVRIAPGPLLAGSALTAVTWFYLVRVWSRSLRWWSPPQELSFRPALRIWFLTNLARFIPGTVWQFAGLAALATAHGVSAMAATGAVLLQQLTLLVTGAGVTLALVPNLARQWGARLASGAAWGIAAGVAAVCLLLLPVTRRWLRRAVDRVARRDVPWPEPPRHAFTLYVVGLTVPWLAYGVAFWLFGRAVLGPAAPDLVLAAGAFVGSYVAGLVAVFAPGGIVVREAALVAVLSPAIGGETALLLAIASRLWLTVLELVTALGVLLWPQPSHATP